MGLSGRKVMEYYGKKEPKCEIWIGSLQERYLNEKLTDNIEFDILITTRRIRKREKESGEG